MILDLLDFLELSFLFFITSPEIFNMSHHNFHTGCHTAFLFNCTVHLQEKMTFIIIDVCGIDTVYSYTQLNRCLYLKFVQVAWLFGRTLLNLSLSRKYKGVIRICRQHIEVGDLKSLKMLALTTKIADKGRRRR